MNASNIILSAVNRLKNDQNEFKRNQSTPDFNMELLRLRQNWRLKKVSTGIVGDLSYKTGNKLCIIIQFISKYKTTIYRISHRDLHNR